MQHEFFHDFFQLYPQFKLEQRGHQWFDRSSWPADFEGINEADYFAEAMRRRILPQGNPPLWVKLRYAMPLETLSKLAPADFLGAYRREPSTNGWHIGAISQDAALCWINEADKFWLLFPSAGKRSLLTSPENPYFQTPAGRDFRISLRQDADGVGAPESSDLATGRTSSWRGQLISEVYVNSRASYLSQRPSIMSCCTTSSTLPSTSTVQPTETLPTRRPLL
jgi:hypothetical protein